MLTLLSIVVLGFFLGMRHATDADHVVAVTTIVSRERSVGAAALIGVLWGVGHTLTILLVGGAIILFGIVIPPRMGLTMELSVALMLILLGVLNLTGFTAGSPSGRPRPGLRTSMRTRTCTATGTSCTRTVTGTRPPPTGTPSTRRRSAGSTARSVGSGRTRRSDPW